MTRRRSFVDVDLGIGREYGYDNPYRVYRLKLIITPSNPAVCHLERAHMARGMCSSCYATWRRWMNHDPAVANPPVRLREMGITERNPHERLFH